MSGWSSAEIYFDAAGSRGMFASFAFAEAVDVVFHGGAVYVRVDIQPCGNGAAYRGRCRVIPDFRAARHRHDCDCRAHQPVRAAVFGGEADSFIDESMLSDPEVHILIKMNRILQIPCSKNS